MRTQVFPTQAQMGRAAARRASELLKDAIERRGQATFVAATGTSQFEFLGALVTDLSVAWSKTTMFHLDEYIGLPERHPASFRRYLHDRLIDRVRPGTVHLVDGEAPNAQLECDRLNQLIANLEVDVAFVGIGENGHLAFNDPPADFETEAPYLIVELDEACRQQQLAEGWFGSLAEVPLRAISMSVKQIMKSRAIICTVPGRRKAQAVYDCFTGDVTPLHPASILRCHGHAEVFLDADAASILQQANLLPLWAP